MHFTSTGVDEGLLQSVTGKQFLYSSTQFSLSPMLVQLPSYVRFRLFSNQSINYLFSIIKAAQTAQYDSNRVNQIN